MTNKTTHGIIPIMKIIPLSDGEVSLLLAELSNHGLMNRAAKAINRSRRAVELLIDEDGDLALAVEEAIEQASDRLEMEARRRAIEGTPEPIYNSKGELVGEKLKYSDALLIALLKGRRGEVFHEKAQISATTGDFKVVVQEFSAKDARERIRLNSTITEEPKALPDKEIIDIYEPAASRSEDAEMDIKIEDFI